jgi:hypothetical protein
VVLSERVFNMLASGFRRDTHLARSLAIGAVRKALLEMRPRDRQAAS